jgi:hypothetical protein
MLNRNKKQVCRMEATDGSLIFDWNTPIAAIA